MKKKSKIMLWVGAGVALVLVVLSFLPIFAECWRTCCEVVRRTLPEGQDIACDCVPPDQFGCWYGKGRQNFWQWLGVME